MPSRRHGNKSSETFPCVGFLLIVAVLVLAYLLEVTTPTTIAIHTVIILIVAAICSGVVLTLFLRAVVHAIYSGWIVYFNEAIQRREDVLYATVYALLCDVTGFDDLSVEILNFARRAVAINEVTVAAPHFLALIGAARADVLARD